MLRKLYGSVKTNLILTDKADKFYSSAYPLRIFERSDGLYDVDGVLEGNELTGYEVNALLEEVWNDAAYYYVALLYGTDNSSLKAITGWQHLSYYQSSGVRPFCVFVSSVLVTAKNTKLIYE